MIATKFEITVTLVDDDGGIDVEGVLAAVAAEIPALDPAALVALATMLGGLALVMVRR